MMGMRNDAILVYSIKEVHRPGTHAEFTISPPPSIVPLVAPLKSNCIRIGMPDYHSQPTTESRTQFTEG